MQTRCVWFVRQVQGRNKPIGLEKDAVESDMCIGLEAWPVVGSWVTRVKKRGASEM